MGEPTILDEANEAVAALLDPSYADVRPMPAESEIAAVVLGVAERRLRAEAARYEIQTDPVTREVLARYTRDVLHFAADLLTEGIPADAEPLLDPDCRAAKHASCVGGPCECSCHWRDDDDDSAVD